MKPDVTPHSSKMMLSISSDMQIKCKIIHLIAMVWWAKQRSTGFNENTRLLRCLRRQSSPKYKFRNCKHVAFSIAAVSTTAPLLCFIAWTGYRCRRRGKKVIIYALSHPSRIWLSMFALVNNRPGLKSQNFCS